MEVLKFLLIMYYDEVVHWWHNLFQVPYSQAGKNLVQELAKPLFLMEKLLHWKLLPMCALMLQKPHSQTSNHDLANCLQWCLFLWIQGNVGALLDEDQHWLLSHSRSHKKLNDDHHINQHLVEYASWKCENCTQFSKFKNSNEQSGGPLNLDKPVSVSPDDPSWWS